LNAGRTNISSHAAWHLHATRLRNECGIGGIQDDNRSSAGACEGKDFVANSPSMIWRNRIWLLCALILSSAISTWAQDTVDTDLIRPSGVNGPVRKAKAVTEKSADDDTESATPKSKKSKSTHARSHRARAKSKEEPDTIPAPTEFTPEGIPK